MAEGDNHAQFTNTAGVDRELAGGTAKANPLAKNRLPEDGNADGRSAFYVTTGNKDILPEHQARRDTYPFILNASA